MNIYVDVKFRNRAIGRKHFLVKVDSVEQGIHEIRAREFVAKITKAKAKFSLIMTNRVCT